VLWIRKYIGLLNFVGNTLFPGHRFIGKWRPNNLPSSNAAAELSSPASRQRGGLQLCWSEHSMFDQKTAFASSASSAPFNVVKPVKRHSRGFAPCTPSYGKKSVTRALRQWGTCQIDRWRIFIKTIPRRHHDKKSFVGLNFWLCCLACQAKAVADHEPPRQRRMYGELNTPLPTRSGKLILPDGDSRVYN